MGERGEMGERGGEDEAGMGGLETGDQRPGTRDRGAERLEPRAESGYQKSEVGSRKSGPGWRHRRLSARIAEAAGVAGGETACPVGVRSRASWAGSLRADLDFRFSGGNPDWVTNVMAGNLSVKRERALDVGAFDGNFIPPVAYRFETEFAKRLVAAGGRIRFEPAASIRHLRAARGGTRSHGSHLSSASPVHGVGDYYYALRCGRGWERLRYMARRPFREVRTRFHLRHPWYIPVKLVGELRALLLALRLYRQGPRLLSTTNGTNGHEWP